MTTETHTHRAPWSALLRRQDRRQGYRIDPEFQGRFRVRMLAFSAGILLMAALLVRCVLLLVAGHGAAPPSPWVPGALLGLSLGIGATIVYVSNRLSHRYCGPVHRINRTLEQVARGERLRPIRLRGNDEPQYHQLAASLNEALRSLGALDEPRDGGPSGAEGPTR